MRALRRAVLGALVIGTPAALALPANATDAITVGTVGQPSANFWPVLVGINKGSFAVANVDLDVLYAQLSRERAQRLGK
jgi:ABC-type nitrate/sulfonate/bicarbonate transport system substrate-binding protein